jgi:hypothetical protein
MEAARTEWTDKRLDDLRASVDDGFRRVDGRLDRVEGRIDALQRTMLTGLLSMGTMILAAVGAMIALH